jgi:hypothetical protein
VIVAFALQLFPGLASIAPRILRGLKPAVFLASYAALKRRSSTLFVMTAR